MHAISFRTPPHAVEEIKRSNAREAAYLKSHDLKVYRMSSLNIRRVLMENGADPNRLVEACGLIDPYAYPRLEYGQNAAYVFDHPLILGRGRRPLVYIGHPYREVDDFKDHPGLQAVRDLGVEVYIAGKAESFYGFGTIHVRIGRLW